MWESATATAVDGGLLMLLFCESSQCLLYGHQMLKESLTCGVWNLKHESQPIEKCEASSIFTIHSCQPH
jgi:hypothetical protein